MGKEYTRYRPLDLTGWVPSVEKHLLPEGMHLEAGKVELFFDDGPILRVSGLGIRGADGELGVYVEQAAIKLASTQFLLLSAAPKVIEASGVTLRVVRGADGIGISGLDFAKSGSNTSVVAWLNGLGWDRTWSRLKSVKLGNINLLVRDDVQQAEWVLENGNVVVSRYAGEGENGTMTAVIRRLYGDVNPLKDLDNVPVLVTAAHGPGAGGLVIRARLDRANAQMVADYFPPQLRDLLKAQGQVEVGTRLIEDNRIEHPWVTLKLVDVKVQPPKGYSAPMEFPKMTLTASYIPPVEGVNESDILDLKDVEVLTKRGNVFSVSGTIAQVQGDPLVSLSLTSPQGEAQGVFDLFPDQVHGFEKTLKWLRPNIQKGYYTNLRASYVGRPSAFPGCGDNCGDLRIDAGIKDGVVSFLQGISPIKAASGTMVWRGQTLDVTVPKGMVGTQEASNMKLQIRNTFSPLPTEIQVRGNLKGEAGDVMAELNRIDEIKGKVPQGISGKHQSMLDVMVPMPRGVEASFATSVVLVTSTLVNVEVKDLPELKGLTFAAPGAVATLRADKTLRVVGNGTLGANPMAIDWNMNLQPKVPPLMGLSGQGTVMGEWLMLQAPNTLVSLTGPIGVSFALKQGPKNDWAFDVNANAEKARMRIPEANFVKDRNGKLDISAKGTYVPSGTITLNNVDVQGRNLAVNGSVVWNPDNMNASTFKLPMLKFGNTNVAVNFAKGKADITGNRVDLSGYDIMAPNTEPTDPKKKKLNVDLNVDVAEVMMKNGSLKPLQAKVKVTNGKYDVQSLNAKVNDTNVMMNTVALPGQPGRKKLTINIDNLGLTLSTLGIYDQLADGKMQGEITYDTPEVGGGLVTIDHFVAKNPPILVQLLSLLSLEQLLSGSTSTLFSKATIPLRVDNGTWALDNAALEGPSMSLRLNGTYTQGTKELNMDGKMAPAIPLNRLVGKIPLLGGILTGSQEGVVVADFKLKGTTDNPQINVRPLSVITPGLLKDFWRGITGSTSEMAPVVIDGKKKKK